MSSKADKYFASAKTWRAEGEALRAILLACGLDEDIKWRQPCYMHDGKNLAIMQKMKAVLALMFFKGSLLEDKSGALKAPGENSNVARRLEFTSVGEITKAKPLLKRLIRDAIAVEKAGLKVKKPKELACPDELKARFAREPALEAAFVALTPGRQRAYNMYFSAAKQADTRARRIDKHAARILAGKGLDDR